MILIHPSSLGKIMTNAKSNKPEDLSAGAMTYCRQLAKEFAYGYRAAPSSKQMEKGTICEDQSIALYNEVFFTNLVKNPQRKVNKWLTGECDLDTGKKIIDIKTSWSLATFPAIKSDAHDSDYEWQGRAYMMLWDRDLFELAYCMVSTPLELIGWEDESAHIVDHIDPALRVTAVQYPRDQAKEKLIEIKVGAARKYIDSVLDEIGIDHAGAVVKRDVAA
jgi:hypothetical protein